MKKENTVIDLKTVAALVVCGALVSFLSLLIYGTGEEGIRHFNRYSARFVFFLFSMVFSLGALKLIFKSSLIGFIEQNQRGLMLSAFLIMLLHLGGIFYKLNMLPELTIDFLSWAGGALAFFFMLLFFAAGVFNNGKNKTLNLVASGGLYWIWFVYAFTYVGRLSKSMWFLPLLIFTFLLLFARIWANLQNRKNAG